VASLDHENEIVGLLDMHNLVIFVIHSESVNFGEQNEVYIEADVVVYLLNNM
jgi:hypothetical protein